jgi:hypothetical protein
MNLSGLLIFRDFDCDVSQKTRMYESISNK